MNGCNKVLKIISTMTILLNGDDVYEVMVTFSYATAFYYNLKFCAFKVSWYLNISNT